jgi:hypothetical protein
MTPKLFEKIVRSPSGRYGGLLPGKNGRFAVVSLENCQGEPTFFKEMMQAGDGICFAGTSTPGIILFLKPYAFYDLGNGTRVVTGIGMEDERRISYLFRMSARRAGIYEFFFLNEDVPFEETPLEDLRQFEFEIYERI